MQAARNVWHQCPEATRARLRPDLESFLAQVASHYGSAPIPELKESALKALHADTDGTSAAHTVAGTPGFPLGMFSALTGSVDASTFRAGVDRATKLLHTPAEFKQLEDRMKTAWPLRTATTASDWFLRGEAVPSPALP